MRLACLSVEVRTLAALLILPQVAQGVVEILSLSMDHSGVTEIIFRG